VFGWGVFVVVALSGGVVVGNSHKEEVNALSRATPVAAAARV
jgi:hypothetical protein